MTCPHSSGSVCVRKGKSASWLTGQTKSGSERKLVNFIFIHINLSIMLILPVISAGKIRMQIRWGQLPLRSGEAGPERVGRFGMVLFLENVERESKT